MRLGRLLVRAETPAAARPPRLQTWNPGDVKAFLAPVAQPRHRPGVAARGSPGATRSEPGQSPCVVTPVTDYAVAIVTGGSCGPGREFALKLASRGYALVVVYLGDQGGAEAAVAEILAANGTAVAHPADLGDEVRGERFFDRATAAI